MIFSACLIKNTKINIHNLIIRRIYRTFTLINEQQLFHCVCDTDNINRNVYIEPTTIANMELDPLSDRLLHHFNFPDANDTAVRASGEGDCLFNSVSTLLMGTVAFDSRAQICP